MALFTDGSISTVPELTAHDSGLLGVAVTEGIDVAVKLGLAQDELGVELLAMLPQTAGLEGVVVTAPLRLWHVFHSLELVYRDAYNNQLNDRYKGKWQQYRELAQWAAGKLMETGLGITADPVPRAEAPTLGLAGGGSGTAETTLYASIAWVNAKGEEGAAGPWDVMVVPASNALVVGAVRPPAIAVGWNLYVGTSADALSRQNTAPLEVSAVWTQTGPVTEGGPQPGSGQPPSYLRAMPRTFQRG